APPCARSPWATRPRNVRMCGSSISRLSMGADCNCFNSKAKTLILFKQHMFEHIGVLKHAAGTEAHAGKRVIGDEYRKAGGAAQHKIKVFQQRAAAGEDNALIDNI